MSSDVQGERGWRVALALVLVASGACGRVGFDSVVRGDAGVRGRDASLDGAIDAAAADASCGTCASCGAGAVCAAGACGGAVGWIAQVGGVNAGQLVDLAFDGAIVAAIGRGSGVLRGPDPGAGGGPGGGHWRDLGFSADTLVATVALDGTPLAAVGFGGGLTSDVALTRIVPSASGGWHVLGTFTDSVDLGLGAMTATGARDVVRLDLSADLDVTSQAVITGSGAEDGADLACADGACVVLVGVPEGGGTVAGVDVDGRYAVVTTAGVQAVDAVAARVVATRAGRWLVAQLAEGMHDVSGFAVEGPSVVVVDLVMDRVSSPVANVELVDVAASGSELAVLVVAEGATARVLRGPADALVDEEVPLAGIARAIAWNDEGLFLAGETESPLGFHDAVIGPTGSRTLFVVGLAEPCGAGLTEYTSASSQTGIAVLRGAGAGLALGGYLVSGVFASGIEGVAANSNGHGWLAVQSR